MTATTPTGVFNFKEWPAYRLAIWAVLINEALLFGAVLAAGAFLRIGGTVPWPRPGDALATGPVVLATLILIGSSAALNESLDAMRRGNPAFSRRWLVWTLLAGALFLVIQAYEWRDLIQTAVSLSPQAGTPLLANPWGAASFLQVFFLATGLHGLHVLMGLGLLAWLLATGPQVDGGRLESVTLYWHFVDFVWIFIVSALYFI